MAALSRMLSAGSTNRHPLKNHADKDESARALGVPKVGT